jgi:tRNA-dihydrouridine synthase
MYLDDRPAVQLFGNSVKGIKSFIEKYDSEVSLWDFNLGCPSKLSKRLGHGGCLDDLKIIEKILKVMRSATSKPVTIKLRKSSSAVGIARMAERVGVDAVGIHARSVSQGYSGDVDYDFALELKKSVSIPVIFSGDVDEENVDKILKDFDFVFVGRAAIGNPGIFSGKRILFGEYLKLAKKYKLFFRQIKFQAMNWTKGMAGAKKIRLGLIGAKSVSDVEKAMGKNK